MRLKIKPAVVGVFVAAASLLSLPAAFAARTSPHPPARGVYYRLVQYPDAGFGSFYSQITRARQSIDMEMYELSDPTAEADLAQAAKRGVTVRVLLDRGYSGGEVNTAAYAFLRSHGVHVRWAPTRYIFHLKATTFDRRTSDISTANLTSAYYATTRDAEVIDTNPAQVKAIEATFANDWRAGPDGTPRTRTVQGPGLVWSPNTATGSAESAMVSQIKNARHAIEFESEELSDGRVYRALATDARRGISCQIVMTESSDWDEAFKAVTKAGCQVHVFPDTANALYIHEKFVLDDPGTNRQSLMIGSQNGSWASLHENRELGVMIQATHGGAAVIQEVRTTFKQDFARASHWTAAAARSS